MPWRNKGAGDTMAAKEWPRKTDESTVSSGSGTAALVAVKEHGWDGKFVLVFAGASSGAACETWVTPAVAWA